MSPAPKPLTVEEWDALLNHRIVNQLFRFCGTVLAFATWVVLEFGLWWWALAAALAWVVGIALYRRCSPPGRLARRAREKLAEERARRKREKVALRKSVK